LYPRFVQLERRRSDEDSPRAKMQKGHSKDLPWPFERLDSLAEEVDLPKRFLLDFEKLAPGSLAPPGPGSKPCSMRMFFTDCRQIGPTFSFLSSPRIRVYPLAIHTTVFQFVLQVADEKGLLKGKTVAVDATTLEASAAMKSIIRRDTGEDWQEYVKRLMLEAGAIEEGDEPSVEEIVRFDRKREDKKVSYQEWQSMTDLDSRISKTKDSRTHLAYKAEHTIDLDTELILATEVYHANEANSDTIGPSISAALDNLIAAESDANIEEAVADMGY